MKRSILEESVLGAGDVEMREEENTSLLLPHNQPLASGEETATFPSEEQNSSCDRNVASSCMILASFSSVGSKSGYATKWNPGYVLYPLSALLTRLELLPTVLCPVSVFMAILRFLSCFLAFLSRLRSWAACQQALINRSHSEWEVRSRLEFTLLWHILEGIPHKMLTAPGKQMYAFMSFWFFYTIFFPNNPK